MTGTARTGCRPSGEETGPGRRGWANPILVDAWYWGRSHQPHRTALRCTDAPPRYAVTWTPPRASTGPISTTPPARTRDTSAAPSRSRSCVPTAASRRARLRSLPPLFGPPCGRAVQLQASQPSPQAWMEAECCVRPPIRRCGSGRMRPIGRLAGRRRRSPCCPSSTPPDGRGAGRAGSCNDGRGPRLLTQWSRRGPIRLGQMRWPRRAFRPGKWAAPPPVLGRAEAPLGSDQVTRSTTVMWSLASARSRPRRCARATILSSQAFHTNGS